MTENEIASVVVNLCFKIHKSLGAGLMESAYEEILSYELKKADYNFSRQKIVSIIYDSHIIDVGFKPDLIIENKVIVELKSVEFLAPVHYKQLLTYLKLSDIKLGLLVNFNVDLIKDGIRRVVNNL